MSTTFLLPPFASRTEHFSFQRNYSDYSTFSLQVRRAPRSSVSLLSDAKAGTLETGGYVTSVLKDAFCVPRPFSPPVIRLSVGSHALEYGFPSTHSSNALSMALFFGELLLRRNKGRWIVNSIGVGMLFLFAWSITFGRLYTGMVSTHFLSTIEDDPILIRESDCSIREWT